ncbi:MAG: hypothetical protein BWY47_01734 [Bacteroidetes bacterium ADurb.Bin302]|nr:MAG: hypothetical protein BWY47_01734 [Bacteroidetes bacterium ADurb.Bin302]
MYYVVTFRSREDVELFNLIFDKQSRNELKRNSK